MILVVSLCSLIKQVVLLQDFIFNNGGLSVAFIFETSWDSENAAAVFSRCEALPCYVLQHAVLFAVMIVMVASWLE
jgi:hypothetical protein